MGRTKEENIYGILLAINYKTKYPELGIKFNHFHNRVSKVDFSEIKKILKKHNVKAKYTLGEFFFEENIGSILFTVSIYVKGGCFRFSLSVKYGDEVLNTGQLGYYSIPLLKSEHGIGLYYQNYEEFEEILVENLQIYEDFKTEFLKQVGETEGIH